MRPISMILHLGRAENTANAAIQHQLDAMPAPMSSKSPVRSSQRNVLACTECVRRKIRCSKTIPCASCIRHNKSAACRREQVAVVSRRSTARRSSRLTVQDDSSLLLEEPAASPGLGDSGITDSIPSIPETVIPKSVDYGLPSQLLPPVEPRPEVDRNSGAQTLPSPNQTSDRRMTDEAAAALQFLAHGRRNVLDQLSGRNSAARTPPSFSLNTAVSEAPWDIFFSVETTRTLLEFHQAHLSWMHLAVHLPTFRREFEDNILRQDCDVSWMALYYAMLSHTLYHIDGAQLTSLIQINIVNIDAARVLFDKSIETLFRANFMSDHKLTSVQAICLLLQVAHNLDKSDLICILISTAIRMSQCLNLHRLGADKERSATAGRTNDQHIIDREAEKRVWWFLVRYDWFQIPFQNTSQVHPAQFNTPMPGDTFEEPDRMVKAGALALQGPTVVTPSRWVNCLNQISVPICKLQERMQNLGFPSDDNDNILKIYDLVISADREIKSLYASWPKYMRVLDEATCEGAAGEAFPVRLMPGLVLLSTAHKILMVHRHFHLSCFRDRRFAFTQLSCITLAQQAVAAIQGWPDTPHMRIIRKMWTTHTFVVSCAVALIFVLLFKSENLLTFDLGRIRSLVGFSREFIGEEEHTSSIARRGVRLLDALMDLEGRSEGSEDIEADIGEVVRGVAATDGTFVEMSATNEAHEAVFPYGQDLWASFLGYSTNGDFLDLEHP